MQYLDFELEIGEAEQDGAYPVAVLNSPGGNARGSLRLPYAAQELDERLDALGSLTALAAARTFGERMFEALFAGDVRSRYDSSRERADDQGRGLRIRLRVLAPELSALPWELLYDQRQGEFLCLSNATPIVRHLELPQPPEPLAVEPPLRVLGMSASPQGMAPIDTTRQRAQLAQALSPLSARGLVELTWLEGQSWRDLQAALRTGRHHIFHFIGHGGFDRQAGEGFIALASPDGDAERMTATRLARLLGDHPPLRLVILGSCEGARAEKRAIFSSVAATLVRRGLPAVLAGQQQVSDEAARELAREFYTALADDYPVDAALAEARKALSLLADTLEWATPALFSRAPDGVLFNVAAGGNARRGQAPVPAHDPARPVPPGAGATLTSSDAERPPPPGSHNQDSPFGRLWALASQPAASVKLPELRRAMGAALSMDEVSFLCSDLGIDVENLGGETKAMVILNLIDYVRRRGQLQTLLDALREALRGR
ncbi:MAG TPA: CHAT domain-containing protein [Roseiflexaceae bacterium]|nr:CHAT domain-containing protein [Roseiflexaceae bacterium]